jgi:hypothetical protein
VIDPYVLRSFRDEVEKQAFWRDRRVDDALRELHDEGLATPEVSRRLGGQGSPPPARTGFFSRVDGKIKQKVRELGEELGHGIAQGGEGAGRGLARGLASDKEALQEIGGGLGEGAARRGEQAFREADGPQWAAKQYRRLGRAAKIVGGVGAGGLALYGGAKAVGALQDHRRRRRHEDMLREALVARAGSVPSPYGAPAPWGQPSTYPGLYAGEQPPAYPGLYTGGQSVPHPSFGSR